jgi:acyl carrier protein
MSSVENAVKEFLQTEIIIGDGGVAIDENSSLLAEGILDSMGLMRLVAFLETEFEVRVEDEFLLPQNFENIRSIAGMVGQLQ